MSGFTPGPWTACCEGACQCKQVGAEHGPVAKIISGKWGDDYAAIRLVGESSLDYKAEAYMEQITYGEVSEEEGRANARLIAAAPDLFSVAIKAARLDGCVCHTLKNDMCLPCEARAALAKARGDGA